MNFYIVIRTDAADSLASARFYKAQHAYNTVDARSFDIDIDFDISLNLLCYSYSMGKGWASGVAAKNYCTKSTISGRYYLSIILSCDLVLDQSDCKILSMREMTFASPYRKESAVKIFVYGNSKVLSRFGYLPHAPDDN